MKYSGVQLNDSKKKTKFYENVSDGVIHVIIPLVKPIRVFEDNNFLRTDHIFHS